MTESETCIILMQALISHQKHINDVYISGVSTVLDINIKFCLQEICDVKESRFRSDNDI